MPKDELERTGAMSSLKLAIPIGAPIDATIFNILMENRLPLNLPTHIKYDLKQRLFSLGTKMMKVAYI